MAEKNSFIVHFESFKYFSRLSDEQLGALFRAMCSYVDSGARPKFKDDVTDVIFEMIRDRIDRDAEKYEEICKKNAENAKKGGRPKKTERFLNKTEKTERFFEKPKKPNSECECDSDPECDPDCDPVCECDPESACADNVPHAPHTPHTAEELTVDWVLDFAKSRGFMWTPEEAERFIAYNRDRGRNGGWDFAFDRWEQGRIKRAHSSASTGAVSDEDIAKANKYITFVNRFKEDDHDAV